MRKFGLSTAAITFLSSCTLIPDQQDVTRVDVRDIVRNVRCETKAAVMHYRKDHWINGIAVAYGFQFQAVENNSATASADILVPISHGTFNLGGLKLGTNKTRDVTNAVDLGEPLGNLRTLDCSQANHSPSFRYPILGKVGTVDAIHQFVDFVDLPGVDGGKFVRTLKFTLKFFAGATPSISIVPSLGHKRDASLDMAADRADVHQLTIIMEPPKIERVAKGPGVKRFSKGGVPMTSSTQRALQRLDYERSLRFNQQILDRLGTVP